MTRGTAQSVAQNLLSQGFSSDDVSIVTSGSAGRGGGQIAAQNQNSVSGNLPGNTTSGVLQALTQAGINRSDAEYYAEAVRRGGALVTVDAADGGFDRVQTIFDRYEFADIGGRGDYYRESGFTGYDETAAPYTPEQITAERQNLKLYAEQLSARKQSVQTGEVTLRKDVITETKSIDVPVTHDEVFIERHAVNRPATEADFRDETIRVPVMEERVTVEKTAVVTGEVSIGKRQVQETQHVSDTVPPWKRSAWTTLVTRMWSTGPMPTRCWTRTSWMLPPMSPAVVALSSQCSLKSRRPLLVGGLLFVISGSLLCVGQDGDSGRGQRDGRVPVP